MVRSIVVHDAYEYSSSGWLEQTFYADGNCGTEAYTEGFAVNTCHINNSTGFKYQLVEST
jgi:hypothetical protein